MPDPPTRHQPDQTDVPDGPRQLPDWTKAERADNIAIRRLHSDADASAFIVRLNGSERPRCHDYHDLTVTILTGNGRIHFSHRVVATAPGDVVFIPKDTWPG